MPSAVLLSGIEWRRLPWSLVVASVLLVVLGLSGIARGDEFRDGEFARTQLVWTPLALLAFVATVLLPQRWLREGAPILYGVCLVLLIAVFAFPPKWGARRWIPLGFMNFQPSELAKLAFVLVIARYLMYRENHRQLSGLVIPFALTLVPMLLVLREPDLGTALLFIPVLFAMLFAAGARWQHLAFVSMLGIATSPVLWIAMNEYQRLRVTALFLQMDAGPPEKGFLYQLHQSKQVLSLGGTWGSAWNGPAVDDPAAYQLPAGRTDFIFCLVGERWGLLGSTLVMLLFLLLVERGLRIAADCHEPFGRLAAVGVTALLAAQAGVNIAMTVGLAPITGVTLPLLSYGGSSLLFTAAGLGVIVNFALRPGYELAATPFRFPQTSRR
jgi:cell division protein FtsW (lipid II flippase)